MNRLNRIINVVVFLAIFILTTWVIYNFIKDPAKELLVLPLMLGSFGMYMFDLNQNKKLTIKDILIINLYICILILFIFIIVVILGLAGVFGTGPGLGSILIFPLLLGIPDWVLLATFILAVLPFTYLALSVSTVIISKIMDKILKR